MHHFRRSLLIIGSGGREHALGWKLSKSKRVKEVFYCPGNGGTKNNVEIGYSNLGKLIEFAAGNDCETIVGPESPLSEGIVDEFERRGLRIFGPTKAAAKLESSKVFSKRLMRKAGIRTAPFSVFSSYRDAEDYIKSQTEKLVVKADGLASGKGAFVCSTQKQAIRALRVLMLTKEFQDSGNKVIVEKRLSGKEASFIVVCDGNSFVPLAVSKDHKRAYNNDKGPNTGGMGSYSPVEGFDKTLEVKVMKSIISPTIGAMRSIGCPFTGFLYVGLMLESQTRAPYVLEFNARMGDPECQALLVRMESDLYPYLEAAMDKRLNLMPPLRWKKESSVCIVMASRGYPRRYNIGSQIYGLKSHFSKNVVIFHAATRKEASGRLVTAGGRVLGVTSTGEDLNSARKRAYDVVMRLGWGPGGEFYRTDIGRADTINTRHILI